MPTAVKRKRRDHVPPVSGDHRESISLPATTLPGAARSKPPHYRDSDESGSSDSSSDSDDNRNQYSKKQRKNTRPPLSSLSNIDRTPHSGMNANTNHHEEHHQQEEETRRAAAAGLLKVSLKKSSSSGEVFLTENDIDVITSFCKNTLFREVKFVSHDRQMMLGGKICDYVLDGVNCRDEHRQQTWELVHSKVKKIITQKRNNSSGEVKKAFMSKYAGIASLEFVRYII